MGSYYTMYDRFLCPYCHRIIDEVVYFTGACDEDGNEQGFDTGRCNHCKKEFRIDMDFSIDKL